MRTANETAESFQTIKEAADDFAGISDNMTHITVEQKEAIEMVSKEVRTVLAIADTNQGLVKETDETDSLSLKQAEELEQIVSDCETKELLIDEGNKLKKYSFIHAKRQHIDAAFCIDYRLCMYSL